jgi:hypothetical protein
MHCARSIMFAAAMAATALCSEAVRASEPEALAFHYKWRAELDGPTERCKVPEKILFLADDAIIGGKIKFRGKTYYPRGRLETTLETKFFLVTRYDDPKPLVFIEGKAGGGWNGTWASTQPGCKGAVRISPR